MRVFTTSTTLITHAGAHLFCGAWRSMFRQAERKAGHSKKEMIMTTLIRSVLVAAALLGTVSAVSAAPRDRTNPYAYDNSYTSGAIDDFNRLTHKSD